MSHRVERITLTCARCGAQFSKLPCQLRHGRARFCSMKCARVPRTRLNCQQCGQDFDLMQCEIIRGRGRYCSKACHYAARARRLSLVCAECGQIFTRKSSEVKSCLAFCSHKCRVTYKARGAKSYPKIGAVHAHRIVAEKKLGRKLRKGEIVHHRDHDRRNYRPDNLEVLPSQSAHAKLHFSRSEERL